MIGRIYKIVVSCSNEIYIGSTLNEIRHRWQDHKQDYKKWKDGKRVDKVVVYDLFEKYGIENCKIFLIKEYEVVDKHHLRVFEQIWINKLRPINKNNPFHIGRFYNKDKYQRLLQRNPDYNKDKYQKTLQRNPNFLKERYKKKLEKNPNYNNDKYKKELERNPNYNKEQYQKNLQRNPNLNKEKILCECGLEVSRKNHAQHKRSKKHIDRMS